MWIGTCSNDLLQSAQITSVQIRALAALWPSWRRLDVVIASLSFTRKREEHILNFTPSHSRFVLIIRCLKNISSNISPNMFYWQLMIFNLIHRSSSTEKKAARKAQLALRETGPKTAVNCHVEYLDGLVCVFWAEDGVWGYIRSWNPRIWPNGGVYASSFLFSPKTWIIEIWNIMVPAIRRPKMVPSLGSLKRIMSLFKEHGCCMEED